MSDPIYVIQLGSGLYLDHEGVLHQGAIPPVPSYALPGGVLATANELGKLSKTFKDIGNALPNIEKKEEFQQFANKLSKLGFPGDDLAKLLGVVGQIAQTIGTVFVVVGIAVAAAKLLGLFSEGPSPLELLVKARFDALDKTIRALHALALQKDLERQRIDVGQVRGTVADFVSRRNSGTLTAEQINSEVRTLVTDISLQSASPFISLLKPIDYTILFDPDEHENVWPNVAGKLFRCPAEAPPQRASFPPVNAPVFDHRLAVVLAPQSAQTFLAAVRSLVPEFRTTGDFRNTIRNMANEMADLATAIRNTALARTIYHEADFSLNIPDHYVIDRLPGLVDPVLTPDYYFRVGALDLCNHNDAFFPEVGKGGIVPFPGPSRFGSMDFRWQPPAKLVRLDPGASLGAVHRDGTPVILYRILNTKECADSANDQSLQDYSDILLSSGYLTLVQLAAQLRHASTQSATSETVHGDVVVQRRAKATTEVTVKSSITFSPIGEIKATARRETQEVRAFVTCSTQLIPRVEPLIGYRIFLRTLSSASSSLNWGEPDYSTDVQATSYIADPLHPGFQRLVLSTSSTSVLQEELLIEGSSQTGARDVERNLTFKAHTFDWWIPVERLPVGGFIPAHTNDIFRPVAPIPASGGFRLAPGTGALSAASALLGPDWTDGAQTWQGHHREVMEATVQMKVKLQWKGSRLWVEVQSLPDDRNYIAFLVVEETFGSIEADEVAPKVLHTAFPIPINGQLTYVPQSFFDQEKAINDKLRGLAQKFAVSVNPRPGEPVFGTIQMDELSTDAGVARLFDALQQFEPDTLAKLMQTLDV